MSKSVTLAPEHQTSAVDLVEKIIANPAVLAGLALGLNHLAYKNGLYEPRRVTIGEVNVPEQGHWVHHDEVRVWASRMIGYWEWTATETYPLWWQRQTLFDEAHPFGIPIWGWIGPDINRGNQPEPTQNPADYPLGFLMAVSVPVRSEWHWEWHPTVSPEFDLQPPQNMPELPGTGMGEKNFIWKNVWCLVTPAWDEWVIDIPAHVERQVAILRAINSIPVLPPFPVAVTIPEWYEGKEGSPEIEKHAEEANFTRAAGIAMGISAISIVYALSQSGLISEMVKAGTSSLETITSGLLAGLSAAK